MQATFAAEINRGLGKFGDNLYCQSLEPPQSAEVHILYRFGSFMAGRMKSIQGSAMTESNVIILRKACEP